MTKELQKQKVFQRNSFIESRQEFTVMEKRVLACIIAQIKPEERNRLSYEINVKKIAEMADITPKRMYADAQEMADSMLSKRTEQINEEEEFFEKINLFHKIRYDKEIFTINLNQELKDIFLDLQRQTRFTAYELGDFIALTSVHAQRIYELVKQYDLVSVF